MAKEETARRQSAASEDITRWTNLSWYMVEKRTINGNFEIFRRLYHELQQDATEGFQWTFLLSELERPI